MIDSREDSFPPGEGPRVQILDARHTLTGEREDAARMGGEWLRRTGADVLVWGEVKKADKVLRIFFLPSEGRPTRQPVSQSYQVNAVLVLGENFDEDLGSVIAARMVAAASIPFEATGKFVADLLDKVGPRLEVLAKNKMISDLWAFCEVTLAMGDASTVLGDQKSDSKELHKAVEAYERILSNSRCAAENDFVARVENSRGKALFALGSEADLNEAVSAYGKALKIRKRERVPLDWAATQNNLGNAFVGLSWYESGTAHLEAAVRAFGAALEVHKRDEVPLRWAMTKSNVGYALFCLGLRNKDPALLKKAVDTYSEALEVQTLDAAPLHGLGPRTSWAMP